MSIWELTTPSSEKQRYRSFLIDTAWVASEPFALMNKDEVEDYTSVATPSKELNTKTNSTIIWFTPNKSIKVEEPRGRSESYNYNSSQSLEYFVAASRLSTMGCKIDKSL